MFQASKLSIFENEILSKFLVEMLDSLMGCDLGNICAKAER
jgi:hypothetical protein